ncbi:hypothetical protein GW17_00062215 [Ensete ventricosum]|nr:hypothetical protein GW17_00062215 [Ensete ventricosum]
MRKYALPAGEGWPHACCLHAEVAGHGQAPYRGDRPWPGYLQGVAGCGQAPCKGLLPADSPIASKGSDASRRGGRPLAGRLPATKGSRHLHKDSSDGDVVRVKEEYDIF